MAHYTKLTKTLGNADMKPVPVPPQRPVGVVTTDQISQSTRTRPQRFGRPMPDTASGPVRVMGSDRSAPTTARPGHPVFPDPPEQY